MNHIIKKTALTALLTTAPVVAFASQNSGQWEGKMNDAWLDGKIETIYLMNENLNPFKIDTQVDQGNVTLTGKVDSDVEKQLAGQLAKGVDGVKGVNNQLVVVADGEHADRQKDGSSFMDKVKAASTTASVKTQLFMQKDVTATDINVDTSTGGVVTLSGSVGSDAEKDLAVAVASRVDGVTKVIDNLTVSAEAAHS
ncbi:hypothetical protein WH50_23415 [Pokkaliibacter plantistimulans]|uniref:BON domain-containing protein n=1 Tax=Pokkaliibacter plantistimulans TaxID=1635171 RepID=A0ABX5LQM4_9GAMM|nr:BON domain-containing protein [Pokkaliibacter plantistimulans]PXF28961.1 hypothetical protein WH50_23415 [Pokkaliibacter plantistimulans]